MHALSFDRPEFVCQSMDCLEWIPTTEMENATLKRTLGIAAD